MVLARGHGMRDVASHPLNGRDGVQDPAIATVLGNIDGRIATARNGIGSERRSDHDLWVGSLDSEERFAVLIGFAAETCRDEVHKLDLGRRSINSAQSASGLEAITADTRFGRRLPVNEEGSCNHN